MGAARYNLTIEQGANYSKTFTYTDTTVDLTGYSARMQIRESFSSVSTLADLSTTGSGLSISVPSRSVTINLAASTTAALSFTSGVYDLEIVSPANTVTRLLEGTVTLSKEVTK